MYIGGNCKPKPTGNPKIEYKLEYSPLQIYESVAGLYSDLTVRSAEHVTTPHRFPDNSSSFILVTLAVWPVKW